MKRKIIGYSLFFVVLLGGFYLFIFSGNDNWKVKLPVLEYVRPFEFTNQDGELISEKNIEGKVYVAEYFFTTCKGICPKMNRNMLIVYEEFKNNPDFMILSHTVDPETDDATRLKQYADSLQVNTSLWQFLTGTKEKLYNSARVSYLLDDPNNNDSKIEDQFIHTQFFALVDKKGKVRGIYDGLEKKEIELLIENVKELLAE